MAAEITFRYEQMQAAVENIREIADRYEGAANDFEGSFVEAVSAWEGESHDKMVTFIQSPVHDYIAVTIPKLLNSLAELLQANIDQMKSADQQIADNIPASLG